ncbi:MAG: hypothetical protein JNG84_11655, partial [Archangium sp.]|nr:hypothetical protein [Archangium sp.]
PDKAPDDGPPFEDITPEYFPNENRFVARYRAVFTVDGKEVTAEFSAVSKAGDTPGGSPFIGGVLTTNRVRALPAKVALDGVFEPTYGQFTAFRHGVAGVSGMLPPRGKASGTAQVKLSIGTTDAEFWLADLERLDPPAERDDRVLHVENPSSDCNVITGDFSNDLMKYLWLSKGSYPQTVLNMSIRDGDMPKRALYIDCNDIAVQTWDGKLHLGSPVTNNPPSPTRFSYSEQLTDGGLGPTWRAGNGEIVIDLLDVASGMTLHFSDIVLTPEESTGARGTFTLRFSGTSTSEASARNAPGRPSFSP